MRAFILSVVMLGAFVAACDGGNKEPAAPEGEAAAKEAAAEEDVGVVLATVGDIRIGADEFLRAARRRAPANGESLSAEERQEIIQELVEQKMLYLKAREEKVDRDPRVQKLMVQTLMRRDVYAAVRNADFSDEELRAYFDEHQDDFVVPEKRHAFRVFLSKDNDRWADPKAKLEELRRKIQAEPKAIRAVAEEYSEDAYRRRAGDLGFVSSEGKPGLPDEVVKVIFETDKDTVSPVFEADDGWNVVLVDQVRPRIERDFEQMKGSVLRKVKNQRYEQLYKEYVAALDGLYEVSVDEDAVRRLEVESPTRRRGRGRFGPADDLDPRAPDDDGSDDDGPEEDDE